MTYEISILDDWRVNPDKGGSLGSVDATVQLDGFVDIGYAAISHHISLSTFRDHRRALSFVKSTCALGYDFDNGQTEKQVVNQISDSTGYEFMSIHSKSYSETNQKFHVFIPFSEPVTDIHFYKWVYLRVAQKIGLTNDDKSVNESARYWHKHTANLNESIHPFVYQAGSAVNVPRQKRLYDATVKSEESKQRIIADKFRGKDTATDPMDKFLRTRKWKENQSSLNLHGERYTAAISLSGVMKVCGVPVDQAISFFHQHITGLNPSQRSHLDKGVRSIYNKG